MSKGFRDGMAEARTRDSLRHKRVLIAVRLVFFIMISSLALPDILKGSIGPVLPAILAAYFVTNLAMAFERSQAFLSQRVQACLLIFDIATLVAATAFMERYRQDLFLAMFLVVLLASAGQRLSVSIGGFVAVAGVYAWFSLQGKGELSLENLGTLTTGLPVLLVVAIYVGYVTENVAKERRRREKAEEQLTRELAGMNRLRALTEGGVAEQDPAALMEAVAEAAAGLLDAPRSAVFWRGRGDAAIRAARSKRFPPELAARWASAADSPVTRALDTTGVLRFPREAGGTPNPWLLEPGLDLDELLLVAFADRVEGASAVLLVAWDRPHEHLPAEEEAVQVLARQSALMLENASLYRLLSQTRDLWQSAFQSIPTPVVIVDAQSRVVQANPAFLALGEFDLSALLGSPIEDVLEGSSAAQGRPGRLTIPRLNGDFDITKGPYAGATPAGGSVWVLRKVPADVVS